jgi:hypothetical protein
VGANSFAKYFNILNIKNTLRKHEFENMYEIIKHDKPDIEIEDIYKVKHVNINN